VAVASAKIHFHTVRGASEVHPFNAPMEAEGEPWVVEMEAEAEEEAIVEGLVEDAAAHLTLRYSNTRKFLNTPPFDVSHVTPLNMYQYW